MGLIALTTEELMRVQVAQRVLDGNLSLAGPASPSRCERPAPGRSGNVLQHEAS
jgi:hypothetical protein